MNKTKNKVLLIGLNSFLYLYSPTTGGDDGEFVKEASILGALGVVDEDEQAESGFITRYPYATSKNNSDNGSGNNVTSDSVNFNYIASPPKAPCPLGGGPRVSKLTEPNQQNCATAKKNTSTQNPSPFTTNTEKIKHSSSTHASTNKSAEQEKTTNQTTVAQITMETLIGLNPEQLTESDIETLTKLQPKIIISGPSEELMLLGQLKTTQSSGEEQKDEEKVEVKISPSLTSVITIKKQMLIDQGANIIYDMILSHTENQKIRGLVSKNTQNIMDEIKKNLENN